MRIRRLLALATLAFAGSALAAPAALAAYTPSSGQGTVSSTTTTQGGTVQFSGDGFQPGGTVSVTVNGTSVGSATAGANGTFVLGVKLTACGTNTLTGTGTDPNGGARSVSSVVTVTCAAAAVPQKGALPFTGTNFALPGLALGLGLVLLGTFAVTLGRRRRSTV